MELHSINANSLPGLSDDEKHWYDDMWDGIKSKGGEILEEGQKAAVNRGKEEINKLIQGKNSGGSGGSQNHTPSTTGTVPTGQIHTETGNPPQQPYDPNQQHQQQVATVNGDSIISKVKQAPNWLIGGGVAGATYLATKSIIGGALAGAIGYLVSKKYK